jgi:16S rRNA (cytosine1402-N4)-methyltransferase
MFKHIPVLSEEVSKIFGSLKKGDRIADGTLGGGGHSKILLEKGFRIIGIDRDKEAISAAKENLKGFDDIIFVHGNFSDIGKILKDNGIEKVEGILLDLGVSTHQLEAKERGFGFQGDLDMRMDSSQELTAEKIVNEYSFDELQKMLYKNGERVHNREIAGSIVKYRQKQRIATGGQLLKLIKFSMPEKYRKSRIHHWATPTFRALSIEVNKDYENLEKVLNDFSRYLSKDGILIAITFHSIESGIVKKSLKMLKKKGIIDILTKNGISASKEEIEKNPKSKRAVLWAARRK